jgi:hypothetical protein
MITAQEYPYLFDPHPISPHSAPAPRTRPAQNLSTTTSSYHRVRTGRTITAGYQKYQRVPKSTEASDRLDTPHMSCVTQYRFATTSHREGGHYCYYLPRSQDPFQLSRLRWCDRKSVAFVFRASLTRLLFLLLGVVLW